MAIQTLGATSKAAEADPNEKREGGDGCEFMCMAVGSQLPSSSFSPTTTALQTTIHKEQPNGNEPHKGRGKRIKQFTESPKVASPPALKPLPDLDVVF